MARCSEPSQCKVYPSLSCNLPVRNDKFQCLWILCMSEELWTAPVRPDCAVKLSDPACSGNTTDLDTASQSMANLYTDGVVSFEAIAVFL
jgi:hypothetical protein